MRCLMCGRSKDETGFMDLLDGQDPLCTRCRSEWERADWHFKLNGVPAYVPYVYNDAFSSCLIQFKECGDEALKDVFLYDIRNMFKRMYRGYTILLMPSSFERREERGFSHLEEIFSCTGMKMAEPFEKKHDVSQKQKGVEERLKMRHEIVLKQGAELPAKIVLADDIITTGSTLLGALDCIDRKNRKIRIFALSAGRHMMRAEHGFRKKV